MNKKLTGKHPSDLFNNVLPVGVPRPVNQNSNRVVTPPLPWQLQYPTCLDATERECCRISPNTRRTVSLAMKQRVKPLHIWLVNICFHI